MTPAKAGAASPRRVTKRTILEEITFHWEENLKKQGKGRNECKVRKSNGKKKKKEDFMDEQCRSLYARPGTVFHDPKSPLMTKSMTTDRLIGSCRMIPEWGDQLIGPS